MSEMPIQKTGVTLNNHVVHTAYSTIRHFYAMQVFNPETTAS
jgi:hypothetical protein